MELKSDGEEDGDVAPVNGNKTGSYFTPSRNFRTYKQRQKDKKARTRDADFSTVDQGVKGSCSWVANSLMANNQFSSTSSNQVWWSRVEDKVVASVIEDSLKVNTLHHIVATSIARAGDGC